MILGTSINTVIMGLILGAVWSYVLKADIKQSMILGALGGLLVGIILGTLQKKLLSRGQLNQREIATATAPLAAAIFFLGLIAALITWLIKLISS